LEVLTLIDVHTKESSPLAAQLLPERENTPYSLTRATLIVVPDAIVHQWVTEIQTHAPQLRTFVYKGVQTRNSWQDKHCLTDTDIVLTTFECFSKECNYAKGSNQRSRRKEQRYTYEKSPLVEILWWRVCIDEAQMVKATANKATEMVQLIPRLFRWCITGTPMNDGLKDLYGQLKYLNLLPVLLCRDLVSDPQYDFVLPVLRRVIRRNSKQFVQEESNIPQQMRSVLQVQFSPVEKHVYQDLWMQCMRALNGAQNNYREVALEWLPRLLQAW
jgi:E3 ubiquitin-protein ligase SHPRH